MQRRPTPDEQDLPFIASAIAAICRLDGLVIPEDEIVAALVACHAHADEHSHTDCRLVALIHRTADEQGVVLPGHQGEGTCT